MRGLHAADPQCSICTHPEGLRTVAGHEFGDHVPAAYPNPEDEHGQWFHGTSYDPKQGELKTADERGEDSSGRRHWNTHLGTHFTSIHDTAREFATREASDHPRIAHASLHMAEPLHYKSENHMTDDAFLWARKNGFRDYDVHTDGQTGELRTKEYDESPEDHRYLNKDLLRSPGEAEGWLQGHPRIGELAHGFKTHLQNMGFDGITYGNEHEAPIGHTSAIAFKETPVKINRWESLGHSKVAMGMEGPDYEGLTFKHRPDDNGEEEITAHHPEHGQVGKVEYSDMHHPERSGFPERAIHINMLRVHQDHRRRGVASQLMQHLEDKYHDVPIDHGTRTRMGEAWGRNMYGRSSKPSTKFMHGMGWDDEENKMTPTHYEADWTLNGKPWSVHTKKPLRRNVKRASINVPHSRAELINHAEARQSLFAPAGTTGPALCAAHALQAEHEHRTTLGDLGVSGEHERPAERDWHQVGQGQCGTCSRHQNEWMSRLPGQFRAPLDGPRMSPETRPHPGTTYRPSDQGRSPQERGHSLVDFDPKMFHGLDHRESIRHAPNLEGRARSEAVVLTEGLDSREGGRNKQGRPQEAQVRSLERPSGAREVVMHPKVDSDLDAMPQKNQDLFHQRVEMLRNGERHPSTHPLNVPLKGWHGTSVGGNQYRMIHRFAEGELQILSVGNHDEAYQQGARRAVAAKMLDLYHHTSPENAEKIFHEKHINSTEHRGNVYFSTVKHAGEAGWYGPSAVHVRVPEGEAELDDEFPSGEQHYMVYSHRLRPEHFIGVDHGGTVRQASTYTVRLEHSKRDDSGKPSPEGPIVPAHLQPAGVSHVKVHVEPYDEHGKQRPWMEMDQEARNTAVQMTTAPGDMVTRADIIHLEAALTKDGADYPEDNIWYHSSHSPDWHPGGGALHVGVAHAAIHREDSTDVAPEYLHRFRYHGTPFNSPHDPAIDYVANHAYSEAHGGGLGKENGSHSDPMHPDHWGDLRWEHEHGNLEDPHEHVEKHVRAARSGLGIHYVNFGEGTRPTISLVAPDKDFEHLGSERITHEHRQRFASRFRPGKRVFTHTCGLDHRLWEKNEHLKPEVRKYIMGSIRTMWGTLYNDWAKWSVVYFAGSEASEWTSPELEGNNDFDVLVGVDYKGFRKANPQYVHLSNQAITDVLNQGFRAYNGTTMIKVDGKVTGPWDRTTYVNPDSYDISKIKPYAAYNVSDDKWAVKPPHLPHWSLSKLPRPVQKVLEAASDYANNVLSLPEPERTQQGAALFDSWHSDRSRAFGPEGEGWWDIANLREKWLDQEGTWAQIVDCKHRSNEGLAAAPSDWSNTPKFASASGFSEHNRFAERLDKGEEEEPYLSSRFDDYAKDITTHTGHNYRLLDHNTMVTAHRRLSNGKYQGVGYLSWFGGKPRHEGNTNIDGGIIHKVQVSEQHRRRGLASAMLDFAREKHPQQEVRHSNALSEDGKAWAEKKAVKTASDWHQFDTNHDYRWGHQDGARGEQQERDRLDAKLDMKMPLDKNETDYYMGHQHGTERARENAEGNHRLKQMWEQAPEYNSVEHQVDMLGHELRHEGTIKMLKPSQIDARPGRTDLDEPHMKRKMDDLFTSILNNGYVHQPGDEITIGHGPDGDVVTNGNKRLKALDRAGFDWPIPVRTGAYFHNTDREFKPGDELLPPNETGHKTKWQHAFAYSPRHVYMYDDKADPISYEHHGPHRYEVEPIGEVKRDPEFYYAKGLHSEELNRPEDHPEGRWSSEDVPGYHSYVAPRARVVRKLSKEASKQTEALDEIGRQEHPNVEHYSSGGMGHLEGDDSRSVVGFMPVREMKKYREHAGDWNGEHSEETVAKIREDIREGVGIKSPLTIEHNPDIGWGYLGEGNHRLRAADEEGLKTVPVRVVRSYGRVAEKQRHGVGAPMHANTVFNSSDPSYTPSDIHPYHFIKQGMGQAGPDYDNLDFHHMTGFEYGMPPEYHHHQLLFAKHPDHGYLGHIQYTQPDDKGTVQIQNMSVHREYQRRGVASQLMTELERRHPHDVIDHGNRTQEGGNWARHFYGDPGKPIKDGWGLVYQAPKTRNHEPVMATLVTEHRHWGGGLSSLFQEDQPSTMVPWQAAGQSKARHTYDKNLVARSISHPHEFPIEDVDPRELRATQPKVLRAGVKHYMENPSGETYGENNGGDKRLGNDVPRVYHREDGQKILLTGHHRAAAALLKGEPLRAMVIHGGWGESRNAA